MISLKEFKLWISIILFETFNAFRPKFIGSRTNSLSPYLCFRGKPWLRHIRILIDAVTNPYRVLGLGWKRGISSFGSTIIGSGYQRDVWLPAEIWVKQATCSGMWISNTQRPTPYWDRYHCSTSWLYNHSKAGGGCLARCAEETIRTSASKILSRVMTPSATLSFVSFVGRNFMRSRLKL